MGVVVVIMILTLVAFYSVDSKPIEDLQKNLKIEREKRSHLDSNENDDYNIYEIFLEFSNTGSGAVILLGGFAMLCYWFSLCVLIPRECFNNHLICYIFFCKCFCKY